MKSISIALSIFLFASLSTGCAKVMPWEKGTLAKKEMAWDPDPMSAGMESHIYFSKEGSSGGLSSSGGGCGCN